MNYKKRLRKTRFLVMSMLHLGVVLGCSTVAFASPSLPCGFGTPETTGCDGEAELIVSYDGRAQCVGAVPVRETFNGFDFMGGLLVQFSSPSVNNGIYACPEVLDEAGEDQEVWIVFEYYCPDTDTNETLVDRIYVDVVDVDINEIGTVDLTCENCVPPGSPPGTQEEEYHLCQGEELTLSASVTPAGRNLDWSLDLSNGPVGIQEMSATTAKVYWKPYGTTRAFDQDVIVMVSDAEAGCTDYFTLKLKGFERGIDIDKQDTLEASVAASQVHEYSDHDDASGNLGYVYNVWECDSCDGRYRKNFRISYWYEFSLEAYGAAEVDAGAAGAVDLTVGTDQFSREKAVRTDTGFSFSVGFTSLSGVIPSNFADSTTYYYTSPTYYYDYRNQPWSGNPACETPESTFLSANLIASGIVESESETLGTGSVIAEIHVDSEYDYPAYPIEFAPQPPE